MKVKKRVFTIIILLCAVFLLVSCTSGIKKGKIMDNLADSMHSSYSAEIDYNLSAQDFTISGKALISKEQENTTLKLISPEPYSGMTIEYDLKGAPKSVAIHFSGIDTILPKQSVSVVNVLAQFFTEDFTRVLTKLASDKIAEVENLENGHKEYFTQLPYGDFIVGVRCCDDGRSPLYFEFTSDAISGDIRFNNFEISVQSNQS